MNQIIFRPGTLAPLIAQRADHDAGLSVHGVAQRDLDRYYALLGAALPLLTLDQARFLVAVYNGVAVGQGDAFLDALRMMPVEVRDAWTTRPSTATRRTGRRCWRRCDPGR